jgi:hypothetical protein
VYFKGDDFKKRKEKKNEKKIIEIYKNMVVGVCV